MKPYHDGIILFFYLILCVPAVVFRTCGTIGGGCFARGGEGSVREDTSVSGDTAVTLFGRCVDGVEVEMYPRGPGGKHLRSFICSARSFDYRSDISLFNFWWIDYWDRFPSG